MSFILFLFILFYFSPNQYPVIIFPLIETMQLCNFPWPSFLTISKEAFTAWFLSPMNFPQMLFLSYSTHSGRHDRLHFKTSLQPLNPFDGDPFKNCFDPIVEASEPQRKRMRRTHCSSVNAFQCASIQCVNSTCRADSGALGTTNAFLPGNFGTLGLQLLCTALWWFHVIVRVMKLLTKTSEIVLLNKGYS